MTRKLLELFSLLVCGGTVSSCALKNSRPTASLADSASFDLADYACESGDKASFSMVPAPGLAAGQRFQIASPKGQFEAAVPGDGKLRLDVCVVDEANAELKRVAFIDPNAQLATIYTRIAAGSPATFQRSAATHTILRGIPAERFTVQGLAPALFGNLETLNIVIDEGRDGEVVVVAGVKITGNVAVAAARYVHGSGTRLKPAGTDVIVGQLELGDSFSGRRCGAGENDKVAVWTMDTAQFTAEFCSYQGTGDTTDYRITKVTVVDSSPSLNAPERQPIVLQGADLAARFKYDSNHHNGCDSFDLKLDHAQYAASAPQNAGCGAPIGDAPDRNSNDRRPETVGRLRYGSGPWKDGILVPCGHWLLSCH